MSTTNLTLTVPNDGEKITSETQYGVRYPNGEIAWGMIDAGSNSRNIFISDLIPDAAPKRSNLSEPNWAQRLRLRAEKADIDLDAYEKMHSFVKRTVTIAVTKPENV